MKLRDKYANFIKKIIDSERTIVSIPEILLDFDKSYSEMPRVDNLERCANDSIDFLQKELQIETKFIKIQRGTSDINYNEVFTLLEKDFGGIDLNGLDKLEVMINFIIEQFQLNLHKSKMCFVVLIDNILKFEEKLAMIMNQIIVKREFIIESRKLYEALSEDDCDELIFKYFNHSKYQLKKIKASEIIQYIEPALLESSENFKKVMRNIQLNDTQYFILIKKPIKFEEEQKLYFLDELLKKCSENSEKPEEFLKLAKDLYQNADHSRELLSNLEKEVSKHFLIKINEIGKIKNMKKSY